MAQRRVVGIGDIAMHLLPALAAAALLVGAPAASYVLLGPGSDDPASPAALASAGDVRVGADGPGHSAHSAHTPHAAALREADASSAAGRLVVRVRHDGAPLPAVLTLSTADGEVVQSQTIDLVGGEEALIETDVPVGAYVFSLEAQGGLTPIDAFGVGGRGEVDLAECPAASAEFLAQTFYHRSRQGIVVPPVQCMPGPARHLAMQRIGAAVSVPAPSCPLECRVTYSFANEGALEFDVPEGTATIRATASWDPDVPKPQGLDLWLVEVDGCGENCNLVVASAHLEDDVSFEHSSPTPGVYGLVAHLAGPAGATADEYVWLMATVVPV